MVSVGNCSGYAVYHGMEKEIIIAGCLAHIKRKFVDALKAMKPEDRAGSIALAKIVQNTNPTSEKIPVMTHEFTGDCTPPEPLIDGNPPLMEAAD